MYRYPSAKLIHRYYVYCRCLSSLFLNWLMVIELTQYSGRAFQGSKMRLLKACLLISVELCDLIIL